jgi:hypothetical protein
LIAGLQLKIPNNKVKISFPNDKVGFSWWEGWMTILDDKV